MDMVGLPAALDDGYLLVDDIVTTTVRAPIGDSNGLERHIAAVVISWTIYLRSADGASSGWPRELTVKKGIMVEKACWWSQKIQGSRGYSLLSTGHVDGQLHDLLISQPNIYLSGKQQA